MAAAVRAHLCLWGAWPGYLQGVSALGSTVRLVEEETEVLGGITAQLKAQDHLLGNGERCSDILCRQ